MSKARALTIAVLILALGACNLTGNAPLEPIAAGTRVQIRTEGADGTGNPVNDDDFVMGSAATGAAGGFALGTLASLSCGPLFFFCAPLAGAAVGAAGFVAGGIFGAATAINSEEQAAFNSILEATFSGKNPQDFLQDSFAGQAAARWKLVDAGAERLITLSFDEFAVVQHSPDRFSLGLAASLTVVETSEPENKPRRYRFQQVTPARELAFFLDESGDNFRAEFDRGLAALTSQMINLL